MNRRRFARRPARSVALRRQMAWQALLAAMPSFWCSLVEQEAPFRGRVDLRRKAEVGMWLQVARLVESFPQRHVVSITEPSALRGHKIGRAVVDEVWYWPDDAAPLVDRAMARPFHTAALERWSGGQL